MSILGFCVKSLKDVFRQLHVKSLSLRGNLVDDIELEGKVLIVAPHPDDEVIGCGGLIARLVKEGNMPHIAILTGGEGSHGSCCSIERDQIVLERRKLTRRALDILEVGSDHLYEINFPDGGISEAHPQVETLAKLIEILKPDAVFVPHWGEGWSDHVKTAEIVKNLLPDSASVYEYCVWMWYYNVWRGLNWTNAFNLRMTPMEHRLKLTAMDAYINPLAPCGKPWSGVLPKVFVKANSGNRELYFKAR